jgi:hypothetical protein
MAEKPQRGVRPEDVVAALHRFFTKFLEGAEQERSRRGVPGQLYAAQVVFWPKLETKIWLNDEVALKLKFADGRTLPPLAGYELAYVLTGDNTIASVAADEGSLGHITVLVRHLVEPRLATQPLILLVRWARGLAAWDMRSVLAQAIVLVPEGRRALIDLETDLEKEREKEMREWEKEKEKEKEWEKEMRERKKETREREKQRRGGIAIPESKAGRELLKLLQPRRAWRALYDRLGASREEWLANALAEMILDKRFEGRAAALLPMEYLNVDDQGIVLWDGWLGEKRSLADVISEQVRAALEAEALGRGFGSRRSKRKVVPASELGEGGVDLEELSAAAPTSSLLDKVETRLDLQRAIPQLTPAQRDALALQLEAQKERVTLEEVCERRGVGYDSTRKSLERARRRLKLILGQ